MIRLLDRSDLGQATVLYGLFVAGLLNAGFAVVFALV
jgi:hypothetical protein